MNFFFTKCCVLKKKLYLCTRKKVRKNNFENEIVEGPDKLNVRGFYITNGCKSVLKVCNGFIRKDGVVTVCPKTVLFKERNFELLKKRK